jgi:nitroreductase
MCIHVKSLFLISDLIFLPMEYTELIRTRESVRNYDPERPVAKDVLVKILDAGRISLSAANRQPWKFLVISSPALLDKVRDCYKRDWLRDAPHILVVLGLKDQAWVRSFDGYNSVETDAAIVMTHIILAARNEGVSTCWIAAYDPGLLREALQPGENEIIFGITPLGYPKPGYVTTRLKERKRLEDIVKYL